MCFVGFALNITLCIQDIQLFYSWITILLQRLITNRVHVLEYLYSVQASFFSLCHLCSFSGVTTRSLIHPPLSLITTIKLCNCFKVSIGLMVKSLPSFLPLWQLSKGGHLYLCCDWVYCVINNFTMLKVIFNGPPEWRSGLRLLWRAGRMHADKFARCTVFPPTHWWG